MYIYIYVYVHIFKRITHAAVIKAVAKAEGSNVEAHVICGEYLP